MKIGKRAREILKKFGNISAEQVIQDDYLFAVDSSEATANSVTAFYTLPENEVVLDENGKFPAKDINEFLDLIDTLNQDELEMAFDGNRITMKDKRLTFTYNSTYIDKIFIPDINKMSKIDELSNIGSFVLDEMSIKDIKNIQSKLKSEKVVFSINSNDCKVNMLNKSTDNDAEISIDGSSEENLKLRIINPTKVMSNGTYSTVSFLDVLYEGIYSIDIKNANGKFIFVMKNKSIEEGNGELTYIFFVEEDDDTL